MKITRERTVRGKKWFPNQTGSVGNQQEALQVGMDVVSGYHSSCWGVGGVTAKEPGHSLTRTPVPGLQQPGQGKRRFPKMLTQPLAPRGPCDLREKAMCHWESDVSHAR